MAKPGNLFGNYQGIPVSIPRKFFGRTRDFYLTEYTVRLYHEYCSRFYEYLDSSEGQAVLRLFNEKYPHTGFTDAKKVDFIMWADVK